MTTLDELTPHPLSVDEVGKAATAIAHAAHCRFVSMYNVVMSLPPKVAGELAFSTKILQLTLEYRAAIPEPPPLAAVAALLPDDPRLPQETP